MTQVFEDVRVNEAGFDLPDLKFRELVFIGALKRLDDGSDAARAEVVVDPARPLPPFRREGLFPPHARFVVFRDKGRAAFISVPMPTDAPLRDGE